MSLQNNNEMKKRNYLQNDSSISLEWWLQQKIGIVLIVSMIPVFHWNNEDKKIFDSSNLLGPLNLGVGVLPFQIIYRQPCMYRVGNADVI